jgi:hypothetical protein
VGFLLVDSTPLLVGGVAGWNITPEDFDELGTLLGPEKTSAGWWLFFLVAAPGLDRLTHPWWPLVWGGGCGGGCGGWGCGGVLSVA